MSLAGIGNLDYTVLLCERLVVTRAFYRDVMGFALETDQENWVSFRVGATLLTLRPRGVWAAHIPALKERPELGETILHPLHTDPSNYVQDSVANWINDAAKTRPDWAIELCGRWAAESDSAATARIVKRALRSVDHTSALP